MDAYTVQTYVANFLNAAQITHLDHVYEDQPEAFGVNLAAYGSGTTRCVAFVAVQSDTDVRHSGPAADPQHGRAKGGGERELSFTVDLTVVHVTAEDNWLEAARQLKQDVVEGIRLQIISDPSLGTWGLPRPLFPGSGEGKRGITRTYAEPYVDEVDDMRKQWAQITFRACIYEFG
jgi:hypothetical protein